MTSYNARTREGEFIPFDERKGTRNGAINFCIQRVANIILVASNVTTKRSELYFDVRRFTWPVRSAVQPF